MIPVKCQENQTIILKSDAKRRRGSRSKRKSARGNTRTKIAPRRARAQCPRRRRTPRRSNGDAFRTTETRRGPPTEDRAAFLTTLVFYGFSGDSPDEPVSPGFA